eukprot:evm.model.scf_708.1 EVM.evm.TU.scf_708.1   scf_708:23400-32549(-)
MKGGAGATRCESNRSGEMREIGSPAFRLASAEAEAGARPSATRLIFRRPVALLALVPQPGFIFVAGALAGAVGKVIIAPLDRVKILLQVRGGFQRGAVGAAAARGGVIRSMRAIVKEEGVLQLWKGCLPQVLRVVPYSATQLASYEALKHLIRQENGELPVFSRLCAGAGAGLLATLVTYPLDTLRVRLAVDPMAKTLTGATRAMFREGGVAALYRGLAPALIGIAPYMALELASFDLLPKEIGSFARGFTAALIATSFCYPLDTVRRQIQLQSQEGLSILSTTKRIVGAEGMSGLYRGFFASAVKNLPNKGVRFSTFSAVKSLRQHAEAAYAEEVELEEGKTKRQKDRFKIKGRPLGAIGALASVCNDRKQTA